VEEHRVDKSSSKNWKILTLSASLLSGRERARERGRQTERGEREGEMERGKRLSREKLG
jgi:hypothetical protein